VERSRSRDHQENEEVSVSSSRQLHLGAFMRPVSIHTAAWRYPGGLPDANFNFQHLKRFAQTLERGRFDAFFMADHLAVLNMPIEALKRSATVTSFDPLTLLPALAVVTEHLGLIATASTTYNEPYHIARKFASLDHVNGGRAGGLNDFVYRVVPELQRRGLFRREHEGATLRENLGLPRPQNRFFPGAVRRSSI
jgi:alkanesulfonate monooxygenase SsuD/methylene tetrahydromethanopterin reductase-like flavin-dependent oxidoreductase (luciferase family)